MSTEEIILDALCFDVTTEQPYIVLRRSIHGLDLLLQQDRDQLVESSRTVDERIRSNGYSDGKGKSKLSERVVLDVSWCLMNEA